MAVEAEHAAGRLAPRGGLEARSGLRRHQLSPVALALGIGSFVVVALLAAAAVTGLATVPHGQSLVADIGLQTLVPIADSTAPSVRATAVRTVEVKTSAAVANPETSSGPAVMPVLTADESVLLSRSAALIVRGDVLAARSMLAKAASDGSIAARFALAETFDPNTLAAWGERERVADVVLARRLYEQALTAGDPRAARRIEALAEQQ